MFDENCFFSKGAPASRERGARDPGPRWAGAPATLQSGASANIPRWARGPRPLAREELTSPAPGGGGSDRAPEWRARPWPSDTFFEPSYPEMQRKHIPRVNEYQS